MTASERITELLQLYPKDAKAFRVSEPKDDGGTRELTKPNKPLNHWLKAMNTELVRQYSAWPDFMHGGRKKRSYISFARPHVNQPYVITLDIRKCFDSISTAQVSAAIATHLELSPVVCDELAKKLSFNGKIAQGFATSSFLCNLYLLAPLTEIATSLRGKHISFTNYVDDLALSGNIKSQDKVINDIAIIMSRSSLALKKAKICVMPASEPQIICCLQVNKRIAITKALRLRLFSDVTYKRISEVSALGWVSNLNGVDPKLRQKFYDYAVRKGVIKIK